MEARATEGQAMRPRTWLAILAVLLCALAPVGLAWRTRVRKETLLSSPPSKPGDEANRDDELVTILVARTHLPDGFLLKRPQDWIETYAIPRRYLPEHAVTNL